MVAARVKLGYVLLIIKRKEIPLQPLDPEQLKFVEILAKLMMENEVFKEEYTEKDFNEVIDWLPK